MEYDYTLQVWFDPETRIIQDCNHPISDNPMSPYCCNAHAYKGMDLEYTKRITK